MGFFNAIEADLRDWKANGTLTARDRAFDVLKPLVFKAVQRHPKEDRDDLISVGTLALLEAFEQIRIKTGFEIKQQTISYFYTYIRFRIQTYIQSDHLIPIPRSAYTKLDIEDLFMRMCPISLDEETDAEDFESIQPIAPDPLHEYLISDLVRGMKLDGIDEVIFRSRIEQLSFSEIGLEVDLTKQAVALRFANIKSKFIRATGVKHATS